MYLALRILDKSNLPNLGGKGKCATPLVFPSKSLNSTNSWLVILSLMTL